MPNLPSAKKRLRQNIKRRALNRYRKKQMRLARKQFFACLEEGDLEGARKALKACFSALDKAAKHGAIHANTAARKKSRFAARLNAAVEQAATKESAE